jgi:hypothetical protein
MEALMNQGAFSIKQFCEWAGIGLTKAYEEINAGRLTMCKLGRKSVIRRVDAEQWLANLPVGMGPPPVSRRETRQKVQPVFQSPLGSRF